MPQQTPLFECHKLLKAKFVDFAGWEMPVYYSMIKDEHLAVRNAVGLFDVSHMGQLLVTGPKAESFLQQYTSNDIRRLTPQLAQYSMMLNANGGVVDDIIVYKLADERYLIVVNASNALKGFQWLAANQTDGVRVENVSDEYALIAVQGPKARELIRKAKIYELPDSTEFKAFHFRRTEYGGREIIIACTGYTGEDGVEIFCPPKLAPKIWTTLLKEGESLGVVAAGLGARDTLRIEAGLPLYGHELSETMIPVGIGYDWVLKVAKGPFNGGSIVERVLKTGPRFRLAGVELLDPGVLRSGMQIFSETDEHVGWVASGTKLPTIANSVGMAFLLPELVGADEYLRADIRGKPHKLKTRKLPFYKRSY